jgi:hypothetical protein
MLPDDRSICAENDVPENRRHAEIAIFEAVMRQVPDLVVCRKASTGPRCDRGPASVVSGMSMPGVFPPRAQLQIGRGRQCCNFNTTGKSLVLKNRSYKSICQAPLIKIFCFSEMANHSRMVAILTR